MKVYSYKANDSQNNIGGVMRPSKLLRLSILCSLSMLMAHEAASATEMKPLPATSAQIKVPKTRDLRLNCPDLKASITLTQADNGEVTIQGTVTNVGSQKYHMASVAEVIMNLAYAPQYSYVKTGISDALASKTFTNLNAGASFTIKTSYTIPGFGGWAPTFSPSQVNARRLFTLRAIKQNMATYSPIEDCNPENNDASMAVDYLDLNH